MGGKMCLQGTENFNMNILDRTQAFKATCFIQT